MIVSALLTSVGINLGLCVILFALYSVLRKQPGNIEVYAPRLVVEGKAQRRGEFNLDSLLPTPGWVRRAWQPSEEELLASCGLDAVVFMRIFIFSLRVFSAAAIMGMFILLPVNYFGDQLQDIDFSDIPNKSLGRFSISNLKNGSNCGCITSAETVMLEKQSLDEFLSHMNTEAVIVSLSPQSRASLAAYFDLSPAQVFRKLTAFFKSLGVKAVYDTSCSRDLSLIESCNEFISRYRKHYLAGNEENASELPMIASACPGWICYVEKTLGSFILPYISSVKSPQQAMGAVIKHHISKKIGFSPEKIFHVTVMPCYDKKLEAARDDFVFSVDHGAENDQINDDSDAKITEVDIVLTSEELLDLIQSKSIDFKALEEAPLDRLLTNIDEKGLLYGVSGGSGGYAEIIFHYVAKTLFEKEIESPLDYRVIRNSDFQEVILEVEGEVVLKFALCYGFQNLRNVVQKISRGKSDYHYLEIMACPSGCLNGGGQIKPMAGQSVKSLIQHLQSVYMQDILVANPFGNPIVKTLYDEWLGKPGSEEARMYMHTQYHPVIKSIASELHNW